MIFDVIRMVFMALAIVLGNFLGGYVSNIPLVGMWGGLVGALIVGMIVYYIYSFLTGQKTFMWGAVAFGILNYVSTAITGWIGGRMGSTGGIMSIIIQVMVLSVLWGYMGGKAQPPKTVKTGLAV